MTTEQLHSDKNIVFRILALAHQKQQNYSFKVMTISHCPYPHLWSLVLGSSQKNKVAGTGSSNELPLKGGRAVPRERVRISVI